MSSQGIQGIYIGTRDYAATSAMWAALGYVAAFETDHGSGQWEHPSGGPYLFIAEQEGDAADDTHPVVGVLDAATLVVPPGAELVRPFEPQHWGVAEALLRGPDGRLVSLQAPLPGD